MRDLASYSVQQWLALVPVAHRLKLIRNRALERVYRNSGTAARDRFLSDHGREVGPKVAVTIAFNTPWVIELFLRAAKANMPGMSIIVADNSSKEVACDEIVALCRAYGVAYARLPRNPEWHPNRSHGIAMNWAYHNLVEPLDPQVFAFLDHDMFLLSEFDLSETVARQPVYGRFKHSTEQEAWSLWAGYSVFDRAAVQDRSLDFNYDLPLRLDTGGYNWGRLYRFLDADTMRFADRRRVKLRDPEDASVYSCEMLDSFVHVGGASHTERGREASRIALFRRLIEHIESGGDWMDFVVPGSFEPLK